MRAIKSWAFVVLRFSVFHAHIPFGCERKKPAINTRPNHLEYAKGAVSHAHIQTSCSLMNSRTKENCGWVRVIYPVIRWLKADRLYAAIPFALSLYCSIVLSTHSICNGHSQFNCVLYLHFERLTRRARSVCWTWSEAANNNNNKNNNIDEKPHEKIRLRFAPSYTQWRAILRIIICIEGVRRRTLANTHGYTYMAWVNNQTVDFMGGINGQQRATAAAARSANKTPDEQSETAETEN